MLIGYRSVSSLPAIEVDGKWRVLGLLPPDEGVRASFASFSGMFSLSAAEWQEIDLSHLDETVWDQGASSACGGMAVTAGGGTAWVQMGRDYVEFNPYFLYGLVNGGQDAGSNITDLVRAFAQYGTCEKNALPPGAMFKWQFPQSAFENAKKYRLEKALRCDNFDAICAAISRGSVVPLGIMVGRNFAQLDSEGVAPLPNGGGGGHAILGCGLKKSSRYDWVIKIKNSWGRQFGWDGYCYLRREHFNYMNPDAYALQSMIDSPGSDSDVPVVS